jgi:hypothetical protein
LLQLSADPLGSAKEHIILENKLEDSKLKVHEALSAINQAWRSNAPLEMAQYLHPDIVMKFPKFLGEVVGRDALLASFVEFCTNARVLEYQESNEQINVIVDCAVVSFQFEMLYEREKYQEQSKGRDLWVFQYITGKWVAVWRTMMDLEEVRNNR